MLSLQEWGMLGLAVFYAGVIAWLAVRIKRLKEKLKIEQQKGQVSQMNKSQAQQSHLHPT